MANGLNGGMANGLPQMPQGLQYYVVLPQSNPAGVQQPMNPVQQQVQLQGLPVNVGNCIQQQAIAQAAAVAQAQAQAAVKRVKVVLTPQINQVPNGPSQQDQTPQSPNKPPQDPQMQPQEPRLPNQVFPQQPNQGFPYYFAYQFPQQQSHLPKPTQLPGEQQTEQPTNQPASGSLQKISPLEGQGILSEASVAPTTDTNTVTDKVAGGVGQGPMQPQGPLPPQVLPQSPLPPQGNMPPQVLFPPSQKDQSPQQPQQPNQVPYFFNPKMLPSYYPSVVFPQQTGGQGMPYYISYGYPQPNQPAVWQPTQEQAQQHLEQPTQTSQQPMQLQVYHQWHQQMQQQIQAQEQAQQPQPGMLRYPSISLEMMQDIARYKRFKQQHPQAVPAIPQASVQPAQQDQQPGQRGDQPEHQIQIPNAPGQQPRHQGQQPQIFPTFGFLPMMHYQPVQQGQTPQFPGYNFLIPAAFPQQQAQPGQEQQQQAAGGISPGFAGFIPGFAGQAFGGGIPSFGGSVPGAEGSIPFAGGVPTGQGTNPVAPEAGLPTVEILPAGQGGGPTIPEVIPTGQGSLSVMSETGNQPAPQSKLPTAGLTTPAWVRMLTPGNSPAAA
ncbi:hypothetical protein EOD39_14590 [Acipenser ruthenus]|uniref:Uncharacterized protein n=1 Tax=Acipenser ruthenus TaxID=7906 RepID=A0A662YL94_ACIRT|nr:hypothetical protein EOD39_14590 [Acipenser ruthenus]